MKAEACARSNVTRRTSRKHGKRRLLATLDEQADRVRHVYRFRLSQATATHEMDTQVQRRNLAHLSYTKRRRDCIWKGFFGQVHRLGRQEEETPALRGPAAHSSADQPQHRCWRCCRCCVETNKRWAFATSGGEDGSSSHKPQLHSRHGQSHYAGVCKVPGWIL